MKKENAIKITLNLHKELCSHIIIKGEKHLVMTEYLGQKSNMITTKIYLGGKIISKKEVEYQNIPNTSDSEKKLTEFMQNQHEEVLTSLKVKNIKKEKTPSDYLDEVKTYLMKKDFKNAIDLLSFALKRYPDEPFLLSYYGCLEAIINRNYSYGKEICLRAFEMLDKKIPFGREFFYPVLYLNLGRACLVSGNKKTAVNAFRKGLTYDKDNKDLIQEMKKIGIRRKPVVSALPRTNPINKYIGMILHKLKSGSSLKSTSK
ncbi:MAG: hypothetical protein IBX72_06450 [Nitrospirae bacterium]|nr:hypothetical protein [Nitrospirota bacterium]